LKQFTAPGRPRPRLPGPRMVGLVAVCLGCLALGSAQAPATIYVDDIGPFRVSFYGSGDGGSDSGVVGQQDWTVQQRADVAAAIDAWASHISNTAGRQVEMHLFWSEMDPYGTNVLGGSSSVRTYDETTIWNVGEYVWKEGATYTPSTNYDTFIQYDITAAGLSGGWNFGDGAPAGNAVDFRSVITHEIGHSLGFSSSYDPTRKDFGWINNSYRGLTDWDKNLIDSDGTVPPAGGGRERQFNATDDPVFWTGTIANSFYGQPVPIYAPDPYEEGSSLSHVDEAALYSALMSPFISAGQAVRKPKAVEWKMMEDMGWDIVYALGDLDENDTINVHDIDLMALFVRSGSPYDPLYDISSDGTSGGADGLVDSYDMDYLVRYLVTTSLGAGTEYGDFNLDGKVDTIDLTILGTYFGIGTTWSQGNANCDTTVDTVDLTILGTYFGFVAASPIPEPVTLVLLGCGACLPLFHKKRR